MKELDEATRAKIDAKLTEVLKTLKPTGNIAKDIPDAFLAGVTFGVQVMMDYYDDAVKEIKKVGV